MKKRVFIIDDEQEFTFMLKLSLETSGYMTVGIENDPASAVTSARFFDPDVILLDVMMPHMDGSEIAAHLRLDPALRDVPVLFMTALVTNEDAPAGQCSSGGQTYLPKSLDLPALMQYIEEASERSAPVALAG